MHRDLVQQASASFFMPASQPVKFVFPELNTVVAQAEPARPVTDENVVIADLFFNEAELARAAAAIHHRATEAARAAERVSLDEAMRAAVAQLADRVAAFEAARRNETAKVKQEAARLFAIFADSCLAEIVATGLYEAMLLATERALADVAPTTRVTIEIETSLADRFRALLAERPGGADLLYLVVPRSDLAPGDVLLSWQDGWAEWSLARLRSTFSDQLRRHSSCSINPGAGLPGHSSHLPHDLPAE
jgi:hypothetical protein